jgi:hypothetical protein
LLRTQFLATRMVLPQVFGHYVKVWLVDLFG